MQRYEKTEGRMSVDSLTFRTVRRNSLNLTIFYHQSIHNQYLMRSTIAAVKPESPVR